MNEAAALELSNVVKRFGAVTALDHAALRVRTGTIHALLGENGAGKTTLMRVAYGVMAADAGTLSVNGRHESFATPAAAIRSGIGMVQQHPTNVPAMTVAENVLLGGAGRLRPRDAREKVKALAQQLGFDLDADATVADLSVAQQQRLEILKAVARNARILILDEPTAILAPDEARELYAWLRSFTLTGGTVVVITHKLEEARQHTDELTVLRSGRTVLTGQSTSISAEQLTEAMLGSGLARPEPTPPSTRGAPLASATNVFVKDERGVHVVKNATFEVHAGEIVGIAGVEGSGHHHVLLAMAGRHPVSSGHLTSPALVGFVPEDRHRDAVALDMSLAENFAIKGAGTRHGRMRWAAIASTVGSLLARYDVRARGYDARMAELSGGNQQKLVLARELHGSPPLLVVENPTRGLDIRAAAFVRSELRAARDRGTAVLVYSSDLDEVIDLSDRVLVVHAGEVREVPRDRVRVGAAMLGAA